MGDPFETYVALENERSDEQIILDHIFGSCSSLSLDDENSTRWILNNINCIVDESRGNQSIRQVNLCPYAVDGHDIDVWDKVGQAVGNLQALKKLHISIHTTLGSHHYHEGHYDSDSDEDKVVPQGPIPDWEILARILRHVRQNVEVVINDERLRTMEEVQPFVRAIHGHPSISCIRDCGRFPYEILETLFSTLKRFRFWNRSHLAPQ
jgi:hypothetical protein